jgi:hypothetical protein
LKQFICPPLIAVMPSVKLWPAAKPRSGAFSSGTVWPSHVLPVVVPSAPGNRPK